MFVVELLRISVRLEFLWDFTASTNVNSIINTLWYMFLELFLPSCFSFFNFDTFLHLGNSFHTTSTLFLQSIPFSLSSGESPLSIFLDFFMFDFFSCRNFLSLERVKWNIKNSVRISVVIYYNEQL